MHTSRLTTNSLESTKTVLTQIREPTTTTTKTDHTYANIKHKLFEKLVPSVLPLLKKAFKARTRWYRGPFRRFINARFEKVYI